MICLWQPRRDQHELARSLNMVDCTPQDLADRLAFLREKAEQLHPGVPVKVGRWHIWRVVREMALLGVANTPGGRAAAAGSLAMMAEERRRDKDE